MGSGKLGEGGEGAGARWLVSSALESSGKMIGAAVCLSDAVKTKLLCEVLVYLTGRLEGRVGAGARLQ